MKDLVLILAHPDDESFAYAGLIQRAIEKKYTVQLHTLTQGDAASLSSAIKNKNDMREVREKEMREVVKLLKVKRYQYTLPDGELTQIETKVKELIQGIVSKNKNAIFTTTFYETTSHPDHKVIGKVIETLEISNLLFHFRPERWNILHGKQYEVTLTATETEIKKQALLMHKSQSEDVTKYLVNYLPTEYFFSPNQSTAIDALFE